MGSGNCEASSVTCKLEVLCKEVLEQWLAST